MNRICRLQRTALLEGRTAGEGERCQCPGCRSFGAEVEALRAATRDLAPPRLPAAVRTSLGAALRQEEARQRTRLRWQRGGAAGALLAAAASLLVLVVWPGPARQQDAPGTAGQHVVVELEVRAAQPDHAVWLQVRLPDGLRLAVADPELRRARTLSWEERPGEAGVRRAFALVAETPGRWRLQVEARAAGEVATLERVIEIGPDGVRSQARLPSPLVPDGRVTWLRLELSSSSRRTLRG